eukprot:Awhi_evm1s11085
MTSITSTSHSANHLGLTMLCNVINEIEQRESFGKTDFKLSYNSNNGTENRYDSKDEQGNANQSFDEASMDDDNDTDNEADMQPQQHNNNNNNYYYHSQPPHAYPAYARPQAPQYYAYPPSDPYQPQPHLQTQQPQPRNSWEYGYNQYAPVLPPTNSTRYATNQAPSQPYYCEPGCTCGAQYHANDQYQRRPSFVQENQTSTLPPQQYQTQTQEQTGTETKKEEPIDIPRAASPQRTLEKAHSSPPIIQKDSSSKSNTITKIKKKKVNAKKSKIAKQISLDLPLQLTQEHMDGEDSSCDDDSEEGETTEKKRRTTGPIKGSSKKRLPRTILSTDQIRELEVFFEEDYLPSAAKMNTIAVRLGLERRVVRVWFQNRRARQKRTKSSKAADVEGIANGFQKEEAYLQFASPAVAN